MRHLTTAARLLLGLGFTAFAINYFIPFLPAPSSPPPAEALGFLGVFMGSGFLTLVKVFELSAGLLLLSNRFVPLALALLAPILVGITAFHVLLAPAGLGLVVVLLALELTLAWAYRAAFAPMLRARVAPAAVTASTVRFPGSPIELTYWFSSRVRRSRAWRSEHDLEGECGRNVDRPRPGRV